MTSNPASPIDQLLAQAALDPRVQRPAVPDTAEGILTEFTALRQAMQLRCPQPVPAVPPVVLWIDEAAHLLSAPSSVHAPEAARLIRQITATGRSNRINTGRRLPLTATAH